MPKIADVIFFYSEQIRCRQQTTRTQDLEPATGVVAKSFAVREQQTQSRARTAAVNATEYHVHDAKRQRLIASASSLHHEDRLCHIKIQRQGQSPLHSRWPQLQISGKAHLPGNLTRTRTKHSLICISMVIRTFYKIYNKQEV